MQNIWPKIYVFFILVLAVNACGGGSGNKNNGGNITPEDNPYAELSDKELADAMLEDLEVTPPAGYCVSGESHCARIFVFDTLGQLKAEQYRGYQHQNAITSTEYSYYDDQDRLSKRVLVNHLDSDRELITLYHYDEQDRLISIQTPFDSSDSVRYEETYTYNGNLGSITRTSFNMDGDITFESSDDLVYDDQFHLIQIGDDETREVRDDRLFDVRRATTIGTYHEHYVYNGEKLLFRLELDFAPGDGVVDKIRTYKYQNLDVTGDGIIDISITYELLEDAPPPVTVGNNDNRYQGSDSNTAVGLNWDGHSTGTCSRCGNMQGEINKLQYISTFF